MARIHLLHIVDNSTQSENHCLRNYIRISHSYTCDGVCSFNLFGITNCTCCYLSLLCQSRLCVCNHRRSALSTTICTAMFDELLTRHCIANSICCQFSILFCSYFFLNFTFVQCVHVSHHAYFDIVYHKFVVASVGCLCVRVAGREWGLMGRNNISNYPACSD